MLNAANTDVYTDFSGFAKLKNQAKQQSPEALKEVAKQFESLFLNMVLKSMRQAKLGEGIFDSSQTEFYQDMYDQQLGLHLSGDPGVGLADMIIKQLDQSRPKAGSAEKMALDDYFNNPIQRLSSGFAKTAELPPTGAVSSDMKQAVNNNESQPIQSPEQFIRQLYGHAEQAAAQLGVDAKALLAQAALETGWGRSIIDQGDGGSSFNLFNIKAGANWQGKRAIVSTLEFDQGIAKKQKAEFRSYNSFKESFNDYVRLIKTNPRYSQALKQAQNPERYLLELQKAGYATDPHYADKVMRIYHAQEIAEFKPALSVALK
ncbi:MAG: flagellar assembly peptidoglycan hydrolase FlgJ [Gammaproteobacteria bacterium HGW-Gammaproteobacteria-3]|nr:MAG: flagellar assembly peptidoglycan hydrolase FlgJ [Gammaproteobacteria bacterium HGW-Gammaproteobacteria-3]